MVLSQLTSVVSRLLTKESPHWATGDRQVLSTPAQFGLFGQ